jgi:glycerol-3-phosphate acyltransferase PlsY
VAVGHCYPVFSGFKGGKGVATLAGVFGALMPIALIWMLGGFILTIMLTGYVSLATLMAAAISVTYAAGLGLSSAAFAFALAMAFLVVWKHRENIQRLARGTESRFEKARVLARWLSR